MLEILWCGWRVVFGAVLRPGERFSFSCSWPPHNAKLKMARTLDRNTRNIDAGDEIQLLSVIESRSSPVDFSVSRQQFDFNENHALSLSLSLSVLSYNVVCPNN